MNFRDLFHLAARASEDLERCNRQIAAMREKVSSPSSPSYDTVIARGGFVNDKMASVDAMIEREQKIRQGRAKECEAILDSAWDAIGIVSADLSDATAQVLSEHYLFGYTWAEVAENIGRRSRTTPKDMADIAMDWLDSYCEVYEDNDGPHVRMRK